MRLLPSLLASALTTVVVAGVAGCAAGVDDRTARADEALGASGCEVFVDKVSTMHSSHGVHGFRIWLKTSNDRIDGAPVRVGFHGAVRAVAGACHGPFPAGSPAAADCAEVGQWQDYEASSFVGSTDYFEVDLLLGNDFAFPRLYEGVFFVQTDRGTRYWLKAGDQNFFLDENGLLNVENALRSTGAAWWSSDVGSLPKTADFYQYLNPAACR